MTYQTEIPVLIPLLETLEGVNAVTEGWPESLNELPLIAIQETENLPCLFADDEPQAAALGCTLSIYSYDSSTLRRIASSVDTLMYSQGYERTAMRDDNDAPARCKVIQYEKTLI